MRPRLALVPGEPAGIGPELVVRAAQHDWAADLTIFGDADTLHRAARAVQLPLQLHPAGSDPLQPRSLAIVEIPNAVATPFGTPDPRNAAAVIASLARAAQGCQDEHFDGLVTGPVHKAAINAGGIAYSGTTGLLAAQAGREVVMLLANGIVRVALATVHIPLRAVADAITASGLVRTVRILRAALRDDFGIEDPVIAVLGLNPHAGEDGHLGREEIEVIEPVLEALRAEGFNLVGPLPADTAFLPAKLRGFDAVLAMYHDQGLPVLKHADFANAVNITLGLPYPRVAVDHGTALELAGTGCADPSSLFAAIRTCAQLARRRVAA
ncbi:MAG: 4-hydroxythreonine-4-phosphate dehydrogenase PdxA [Pseudomonadota bacterium]